MYPSIDQLPRDVLIDTNVLADIVFARVLPRLKRDHLRENVDVAVMEQFIQGCRRRATTAHVLTEIDGHLKRRQKGRGLTDARRTGFTLLREVVDEVSSLLGDLDLELVSGLGIADAGLVAAAKREGLVLLTNEGELEGMAKRARVEVISSWQIIYHPSVRRK